MAITFFSINGAGSGGGGGSTVNTNNGISGDGSIGTPVVLGGKPLTADTTIVGAGHALTIITDNATDKSEIDISHNSIFTGTTVDSSGDAADLTTLNSGGVLSLDVEVSSGANAKRLHMSRGGGGTGIIITDTVDNEGLTGAALFPVGVDPNRYVQQGNLPAIGGNTANGVSGDGSTGSPIILGGNPLIQTTSIDTQGNQLRFHGTFSGNGNIVDENFQFGTWNVTIDTTGNLDSNVNLDSGSFGISCSDFNTGNGKAIAASVIGNPGIEITDTKNNVGLIGTSLFPLSGSSDQYVQAGNVLKTIQPAAQDTAGQTTTQVIPPAYTPAVDSIIRVNAYALYITGTGSVTVTVVYTDRLSASVTAALGTINAAAPHTAFPAIIFKVKGGTTVSVTYTVTGTITYDAGATIENLFT